MKNTQNQNSKYLRVCFHYNASHGSRCIDWWYFQTHCMLYEDKMWHCCVIRQKMCAAFWHCSEKQIFFGRLWFHHSKYWQVDVFLEGMFADRLCKSDSDRINLRRCSVAASNKPLPMTNRACHFRLSGRLLVFHMCSSGSFAASEIIICKDEELSEEAAGLWEQPLYLLFSATASFFLLQSLRLSFLASVLTFNTHFFSLSPLSRILSLPLPSYLYFPLFFFFTRAHYFDADSQALRPYGRFRLCCSVKKKL